MMIFRAFVLCMIFQLFSVSCASDAVTAEEYFTLGMAFFEIGRYPEAEYWLTRARTADRTMVASEYNLGRIAFETGRYDDALRNFQSVLGRDPDNVMVLRAAAFTCIRLGNFTQAENYYSRLLGIVPDSADNGFNHALVLYAMERYRDSEAVLLKFPDALNDDPNALLLLARVQNAGNNIEAIDSYARWISGNPADPNVIYEYAQVLEKHELFALALEQYRECLALLLQDQEKLRRSNLRFKIARVIFIADPGNDEAIAELNMAIELGFNDIEALEALSVDTRIDDNQRFLLREHIFNLRAL